MRAFLTVLALLALYSVADARAGSFATMRSQIKQALVLHAQLKGALEGWDVVQTLDNDGFLSLDGANPTTFKNKLVETTEALNACNPLTLPADIRKGQALMASYLAAKKQILDQVAKYALINKANRLIKGGEAASCDELHPERCRLPKPKKKCDGCKKEKVVVAKTGKVEEERIKVPYKTDSNFEVPEFAPEDQTPGRLSPVALPKYVQKHRGPTSPPLKQTGRIYAIAKQIKGELPYIDQRHDSEIKWDTNPVVVKELPEGAAVVSASRV